jgi:ABC-type lipoprotein export system ATPase subunit
VATDLILRAEGVGRSFRDANGAEIELLRDVDFELSRGERVAICGESGSGKTTLLFLLGGLEAPTRGAVYWNDVALSTLPYRELCRRRRLFLSYIFQNYILIEELSVMDNVLWPIYIRGESPGPDGRAEAKGWLERLGVAEKARMSPRLLSGGERQRVAIARALVAKTQVVLADEPTGNLDENTGRSVVQALLDACKNEKSALVFVTHNKNFASQMDRRYSLENGRLYREG